MLFSLVTDRLMPNDTGPMYQETLMCRLPVEPFNTMSNLIFLWIIIYFAIRVYPSMRQHVFLALSLPILAIGFIGGTIFHATRSHEVWLFMDWVPIMILCMAAVIFFIGKVYQSWRYRFLVFGLIIGVYLAVRSLPFPQEIAISIGYVITAITVLLPLFLYLQKTNWRSKELILLAIASFVIAVSFRSADKFLTLEFLYMGTHWLWHLFGGISVFFLMQYIYYDGLVSNMSGNQ